MIKHRKFRCPVKSCGGFTLFDLTLISKNLSNVVTCEKCGRDFTATTKAGCCNVEIMFVNGSGSRAIRNLQSFRK